MDYYAANINAQYQFTLNFRFKIVSFQAVIPTIHLREMPDFTAIILPNFSMFLVAFTYSIWQPENLPPKKQKTNTDICGVVPQDSDILTIGILACIHQSYCRQWCWCCHKVLHSQLYLMPNFGILDTSKSELTEY